MAGVYSTRFMMGVTAPALLYSPPAGKRAVVKCITAVNTITAAQGASLDIGGVFLWYGSIPGASTLVVTGLQVVIYPGEVLKLAGAANIHAQASGYLLDTLP